MGYTIRVEWIGLENAISHFQDVGYSTLDKIEKQGVELARAGQDAWRSVTPVRSGRLMGGDRGVPGGFEIEFINATRYYDWVDRGHRTPSYFRRHGRVIPAKRVSHVAGREMTEKLVEYLEGATPEYLRKALDEFTD
jgi:hypothetical protein